MTPNDSPSHLGIETPQEILRATLSKLGAPESQEIELEALPGVSTSSTELSPQLHAKTFLVVFAVCLIYFAQLVNLVGAGVVRFLRLCEWRASDVFLACSRYLLRCWRLCECRLAYIMFYYCNSKHC